ncbi:putative glutathione S-transferase, partial [Cucurbita argyrosperma subsp. sororia]
MFLILNIVIEILFWISGCAEKAIEEAQKTLEPLENELENKKFFGGEEIGLVDIVGLILAVWIPAIEEALGFELLIAHKFPNLKKWTEELVNNQVMPQKDARVTFFKNVGFNRKN